MYAIIETGGKQYRVEQDQVIRVDRLEAEPGAEVTLDKVLMKGGDAVEVGAPYLDNANVTCEVVDHGRGKKVVVFHKWRRNDSRKKQGHRQSYTTIKIKAIN
ncbi:50S ribosomal protein L21 [Oceanidesulfovibrio marinus]|uniref:Large ribosomal subunit protein bL21 n=1 Tax=Oceanidesulfovibrio marinus TaxID=370038 RepID=A0A6P1ZKK3_9BACT|nr:50S ribosomal protein L21 [Oceanidesulfovibrio marinus]QJT10674.1 50S ribosomal protein L21 [Oceanidesulfovibrio marinus]TVM34100.1 50S ribosomal protein L21 [Oceanidesulfovibrio marinus]